MTQKERVERLARDFRRFGRKSTRLIYEGVKANGCVFSVWTNQEETKA